jgi:predicted dehydrogenase
VDAAATARIPDDVAATSFEEVLEDSAVEAVVLATPAPTHFELARAAHRRRQGRLRRKSR